GPQTSRSQAPFARMTSGRSRPSGSNRRFSTLRTSRAQLRLDAPIVLFCSKCLRFSSFVSEKSHAANAAYVSSMSEPLMTVKEETTVDLDVTMVRQPILRTAQRVRPFRLSRTHQQGAPSGRHRVRARQE